MLLPPRLALAGICMIVRIAQFAPKPGQEETVLQMLRSHIAFLAGSPGCRRAHLGTPIHGQHLLLYSEWNSEADVERLEGSLRSNPQASSVFFGLLGRLSTPPLIARYEAAE